MQIIAESTIIDGRFEILQALGEGGMGSVFKAKQIELGRTVAIKFINAELSDDTSQRFQREAQTLAQLQHKNIIQFLAYGIWLGERPYLVMEFVEGQTLKTYLQQKLTIREIITLFRQLIDALVYCHQNGIIHRDVKPENIFVQEIGAEKIIKLADFGLARILDPHAQKLTKTGLLVGSPDYMSPEQAKGLRPEAPSDFYSAGCVLFEMISGRKPFESDNPIGLLYKHINEAVPDISQLVRADSIPDELIALLNQLLSKDVQQRPSSDQILRQLDELLRTENELLDKELTESGDTRKKSNKKAIVFSGSIAIVWVFIAFIVFHSVGSHKHIPLSHDAARKTSEKVPEIIPRHPVELARLLPSLETEQRRTLLRSWSNKYGRTAPIDEIVEVDKLFFGNGLSIDEGIAYMQESAAKRQDIGSRLKIKVLLALILSESDKHDQASLFANEVLTQAKIGENDYNSLLYSSLKRDALLIIAKAAIAKNDWAQAKKLMSEVISLSKVLDEWTGPSATPAKSCLIRILVHEQKYEEALRVADQVCDEVKQSRYLIRSSTYVELAKAIAASPQEVARTKAFTLFLKASQLFGTDKRAAIGALLPGAECFQKIGDTRKAESLVSKIESLIGTVDVKGPDWDEYILRLINLEQGVGHEQRAYERCLQVLAHPEDFKEENTLLRVIELGCQLTLNDPSRQKEFLQKYGENSPSAAVRISSLRKLAHLYETGGSPTQALASCMELLKILPENEKVQTYADIFRLNREMKNYEACLPWAGKRVSAIPQAIARQQIDWNNGVDVIKECISLIGQLPPSSKEDEVVAFIEKISSSIKLVPDERKLSLTLELMNQVENSKHRIGKNSLHELTELYSALLIDPGSKFSYVQYVNVSVKTMNLLLEKNEAGAAKNLAAFVDNRIAPVMVLSIDDETATNALLAVEQKLQCHDLILKQCKRILKQKTKPGDSNFLTGLLGVGAGLFNSNPPQMLRFLDEVKTADDSRVYRRGWTLTHARASINMADYEQAKNDLVQLEKDADSLVEKLPIYSCLYEVAVGSHDRALVLYAGNKCASLLLPLAKEHPHLVPSNWAPGNAVVVMLQQGKEKEALSILNIIWLTLKSGLAEQYKRELLSGTIGQFAVSPDPLTKPLMTLMAECFEKSWQLDNSKLDHLYKAVQYYSHAEDARAKLILQKQSREADKQLVKGQIDGVYELANCEKKFENYASALQLCRRSLSQLKNRANGMPFALMFLNLQDECLVHEAPQKRIDEINALQGLLSSNDYKCGWLKTRAKIYCEQRAYDAALADLSRSLELADSIDDKWKTYNAICEMYTQIADYKSALQWSRKRTEWSEKFPGASKTLAGSLHEEAKLAVLANDLELAEKLYRRGFVLQPDSPAGNRPFLFGSLLNQRKKYTEARRWLNEAIQTYTRLNEPKVTEAYKQLAFSYEQEKQFIPAIDNYLKWVRDCRWYDRRLPRRNPDDERQTLLRLKKLAQAQGLTKQSKQINDLL